MIPSGLDRGGVMSEHEQNQSESTEEREETLRDLEVPEEDGKDVTGGSYDLKENKKV
jgi:hypothetical protein